MCGILSKPSKFLTLMAKVAFSTFSTIIKFEFGMSCLASGPGCSSYATIPGLDNSDIKIVKFKLDTKRQTGKYVQCMN